MRRPALLASLLAAAACGTAPTAPEAGRSPAGASVTLVRVGDTAAVAGGALALASESRWLDELPVLDPEALAAGRVRAAAPGTAEVRTGAGEVLTVRVAPARPLVLAASVAPGDGTDTLLLRGFRLRELGAVRVGGEPARVLGGDSATLRLAVAPPADAGCATGGVRQAVDAEGADVAPGLAVARPRRGDLRLAVGQAVRLSAEAAACLRFAPAPGARYALAFLDTRKLRDAEGGFEGYAPSPLAYTVTVAEAGSAAPAAPAALRTPASPALDRAAAADADAGAPASLVRRAAPWREGERFAVGDVPGGGSATARVVRVYGGHLVLALAEGEEPAGGAAAWLARADSAFARAEERAYPLLRAALTPTLPATSAGSGQLLVLARRGSGALLGASVTHTVDGRKHSYALLNTAWETTAAGLLKTLAHELAHAWQEQYAWETRPAGTAASGATTAWAAEGNAELLASVAAARVEGIGLTGNWDWAAGLGDGRRAAYALLAANARGEFTQGYESGASFQMDLAIRMVRAGSSEDEALAAVSRGALDGWHGWDAHGARRPGLTARMRSALDAAWDPADALLRWTLSQAVDDLTANPDLQNHAFRRVSTAGQGPAMGWLAPALLRTGDRAVRVDPGSPATVSGNAAVLTWRYGSPNYFLVDDRGLGGAYRLSSTAGGAPLPGVAWMVVRYQ
ncbi:MAG: hypothetical protein AB1941_11600 [Gemmatimonadota bacterium]